MTDNPFGNGNKNPQFHVYNEDEDGNRTWFWSPERISDRSNIAQGHHINPNKNYGDTILNRNRREPDTLRGRSFLQLQIRRGECANWYYGPGILSPELYDAWPGRPFIECYADAV